MTLDTHTVQTFGHPILYVHRNTDIHTHVQRHIYTHTVEHILYSNTIQTHTHSQPGGEGVGLGMRAEYNAVWTEYLIHSSFSIC